ncbi:MAG: hypothetical protein KAR20_04115, partial [Candidatus Heimdallarchaeota archaeon]|nr:hypothetical protein [Candidatus Heimdallarchaeota archaeon]
GLALEIILVGYPYYINIKPYLGKTDQFFRIKSVINLAHCFRVNLINWNLNTNYLKLIVFILGFLGIFSMRKNKRMLFFYSAFLIIFTIITYLHWLPGLSSIANIQPFKYEFTLIMFLIIPCGRAVYTYFSWLTKKEKKTGHILALILFSAFSTYQVIGVQLLSPTNYKLYSTPPSDYLKLKSWLIDNTTQDARILMEHDRPAQMYFKKPSYVFGLLSLETNRVFLGSTHGYSPMIQDSCSKLNQDMIMGLDWSASDEELSKYFDLYNVGWIVVRTHMPLKALKKRKDLVCQWEKVDNFTVFTLARAHNYLIGGEAKIDLDFNRIKIQHLVKHDQDVILKFHWYPTLKTLPDFDVEPVFLEEIKVPFIKIKGITTSNLEVVNLY